MTTEAAVMPRPVSMTVQMRASVEENRTSTVSEISMRYFMRIKVAMLALKGGGVLVWCATHHQSLKGSKEMKVLQDAER